jgi:hypothetical protein
METVTVITVSLATVPNNPRGATICYGTYSQNTSRSRNNTIKGQRGETTPSGRRPLYAGGVLHYTREASLYAGGVTIRTWEASLYAGLEIRQADKTVNSLEAPALAYATLDSPIYIHQPRRYVGTTASIQPRRAIQSIYVYRTTHNV